MPNAVEQSLWICPSSSSRWNGVSIRLMAVMSPQFVIRMVPNMVRVQTYPILMGIYAGYAIVRQMWGIPCSLRVIVPVVWSMYIRHAFNSGSPPPIQDPASYASLILLCIPKSSPFLRWVLLVSLPIYYVLIELHI